MTEQELIEENKRLKERVSELEELLKRKSGSSARAYDEIRGMIITKVRNEVEIDIVDGKERDWTRKRVEKQIMSDLKWDLRIRRVEDFRDEHIEPAKEYVGKYVLTEELKKSRWVS